MRLETDIFFCTRGSLRCLNKSLKEMMTHGICIWHMYIILRFLRIRKVQQLNFNFSQILLENFESKYPLCVKTLGWFTFFFKKSDNAQNSNHFASKLMYLRVFSNSHAYVIMNQELLKISFDYLLSHLKNPMYSLIRISCGRVLVGIG